MTASLAASATLALARSPLDPIAAAQTSTPGDGGEFDALTGELDAMIEEWMTTLEVPGVAVGVIAGDKAYTAGFGITNIDHPLPVDADTLFQIGSIGKTYTGTIIMRLVDEGRIDLKAPVRTYLPAFQVADEAVAGAVTVRQLLNHTAGWLGDIFTDTDTDTDTDTGTGDDAIARYVEALAENPQIAPLGEHFSYNNAAFGVAGRLIEVVTGQAYLAALTQRVLQPLGLERTFLYPEQIMTEVFASGHTGSNGGFAGDLIVATPWALPRAIAPGGGQIASITDLLGYARFHLGDGTAADGAAMLSAAAMTDFRTRSGPGAPSGDIVIDGVSIAWWLREVNDTLILQHGGSTSGQEALLVLVPDRRFALGLLTNATAGVVLNAIVSAWALERYLGLSAPALTPVADPPADLAGYVGSFSDGTGSMYVISQRNGELVGEAHWPGFPPIATDGPIVFVGDDLVRFSLMEIPFLADFVRTDTGEIGWFRFSGRLQPRL